MNRGSDQRGFLFILIGRREGFAAPLLQELVQVSRVECAREKRRLREHPAEKGDSRPDAKNLVLP